jgi:hypothetical protein
MSNKKEVPKQTFFWRTEKKAKSILPMGSPIGHPVEGQPDVFFLTTAHEDVLVQAPLSRWTGDITK